MESDADFSDRVLDTIIGLGANVGSPQLALTHAVGQLSGLGELVAISSLYKTAPVGGPPQPDFLNAAVRLSFRGSPAGLLGSLRGIEYAAGRRRRERWGPRSLDLDILWIKDLQLNMPRLKVPHPRLRERAFALRPLLDVAPDAVDPADGALYADLLRALGCAGVEDVGRSWVDPAIVGSAAGMDRPRP